MSMFGPLLAQILGGAGTSPPTPQAIPSAPTPGGVSSIGAINGNGGGMTPPPASSGSGLPNGNGSFVAAPSWGPGPNAGLLLPGLFGQPNANPSAPPSGGSTTGMGMPPMMRSEPTGSMGGPFGNPLLSLLFGGLGSNARFYAPGNNLPQTPALGPLMPLIMGLLGNGGRSTQPVAQRAPTEPQVPAAPPQATPPGFNNPRFGGGFRNSRFENM